jgi:hypothetical protein
MMLFLGGMTGFLHETFASGQERPTLILLFAAMMGLPVFLKPPGDGDNE